MHEEESVLVTGKLFELFGLDVTNTMLAAFLAMAVLVIIAVIVNRTISLRPSKFQVLVEMGVGYVYDLCISISDNKRGRAFFPWIATFFFFILISFSFVL